MVYQYQTPCLSEEVRNEGYFVPSGRGLAVCEAAPVYCPRNPEESIVYGVVAEHLETYLAMQRQCERVRFRSSSNVSCDRF